LGDPDSPLPNFVSIGTRSFGSGFLGARHQPLIINDPTRGVENLRPAVASEHFTGRVGLLEELEAGFERSHGHTVGSAHHTTYQRAVTLMNDQRTRAFDISNEPQASRAAYGSTRFGEGCLLARRLIETGIKFVEVTLGGWDTHQNN